MAFHEPQDVRTWTGFVIKSPAALSNPGELPIVVVVIDKVAKIMLTRPADCYDTTSCSLLLFEKGVITDKGCGRQGVQGQPYYSMWSRLHFPGPPLSMP